MRSVVRHVEIFTGIPPREVYLFVLSSGRQIDTDTPDALQEAPACEAGGL